MKKIVSLILCIIIVFALVSCAKKEKKEKYCSNCGDRISETASFCSNCGTAVSTEPEESSSITSAENQISSEEPNKLTTSNTSSINIIDSSSNSTIPQTPPHTHSFSLATCTEPEKCSCGATKGNALGHKWKEATCTHPKVCLCGALEGSALGHNYVDGVCTLCSVKDPDYIPISVTKKNGKWSVKYLTEEGLTKITVDYDPTYKTMSVGYEYGVLFENLPIYTQEEIRNDVHSTLDFFEGKEYWYGSGDGYGYSSVEENGNTIIITNPNSNDSNSMTFERVDENTLKIIDAVNTNIIGKELKFEIQ